jgi:hypothetical protein
MEPSGFPYLVFAKNHLASINLTASFCSARTCYSEIRFQSSVLFSGVLSLALAHCLCSSDDGRTRGDGSQNTQYHDARCNSYQI